jgi:hypothetical protein
MFTTFCQQVESFRMEYVNSGFLLQFQLPIFILILLVSFITVFTIFKPKSLHFKILFFSVTIFVSLIIFLLLLVLFMLFLGWCHAVQV